MKKQLVRAIEWFRAHCTDPLPVYVKGAGHAIAWLYRLIRPGKPTVWYCVDMEIWEVKRIRRLCK